MYRSHALVIAICLAGCMAHGSAEELEDIATADSALELSDVSGHPAAQEIDRLNVRGIVRGFSDGTFRPDSLVTRSHFAALVATVREPFDRSRCGVDRVSPGCASFSDVPESHWAFRAIAAAARHGFVRGYPDGTFGPARGITRAELLVALVNGLGIERDDAAAERALSRFSDASSIPAWAREALGDAAAAGLLGNTALLTYGGGANALRPGANATRGELASFLARALDVLPRADWVGDMVARIDRDGGAACEGTGTAALGSGVAYGTWARQRAAVATLCAQVYEPGLSDRDLATADRALDVFVRCVWLDEAGEDRAVRTYPATIDARVGNNARFRAGLPTIDPFSPYTSPDLPYWIDGSGTAEQAVAQADCSFEVNGERYGSRGAGSTFRLTFTDYPNVGDRGR